MSVYERMAQKNIFLPELEAPSGSFVLARAFGGRFLYLSGAGPAEDFSGKLGDISVEQGIAAARSTGLSVLAVLHNATGGDLNRIGGIIKVTGFINSQPYFTNQSAVLNGFSDLMIEVFGADLGQHARSAIGVAALPGNIPVEVELLAELRRGGEK